MKSTPYAAGRRAEYLCIKTLRNAEWKAVRTAGSHGPFDVIAWKGTQFLVIQVKKVQHHQGIAATLRAASLVWQASGLVPNWQIGLETWVRQRGYWHIYPYPFTQLDRRVK